MSSVALAWSLLTPQLNVVERSERNASALGDPEIINPKVAGFESKERLRSSEIKEDGLCFVLRVSEELYLNIY